MSGEGRATPPTAHERLPGDSPELEAKPERNEYDEQAEAFLRECGLTFEAEWKDARCPPFEEQRNPTHIHGDRWRATLRGKTEHGLRRISFDYWNSFVDRKAGTPLRAYSVLACIAREYYTPETFEDFCSEYGYDTDSRRAESLFRRCDVFAKRLRSFFTEAEAEKLSEIQ